MFSGLVEELSSCLKVVKAKNVLRFTLKRPASFRYLKEGESISVDGLCLTLEKFNKKEMTFALGPETLKITGWKSKDIKAKLFNLERSLTLQSALGGQILTGHVDGRALVKKAVKKGESVFLTIQVPKKFQKFFWKKGYIALNGVSLTINEIKNRDMEICLVPKTLKLTNLSLVREGDSLNFEGDYMSRSFIHCFQNLLKSRKNIL